MSERSGVYDASGGSPDYIASEFSEFISLLALNVIPGYLNELEISIGTGLQIKVDSGGAIKNGRFYVNDADASGGSPLTISIDAATTGYLRKDRIAVKWDILNSTATSVVVKGTEAVSSPSLPTLTDTGTVWYESLGIVNVDGSSIDSVEDDRTVYGARRKIQSEEIIASMLASGVGAISHTITSTNGNTYSAYPLGISYSYIVSANYAQSGQTDNTDFPFTDGTVLTINAVNNGYHFFQIGQGQVAGTGMYKRSYAGGTYTAWKRIDDDLPSLTTTDKTSVVAAVNELKSDIDDLTEEVYCSVSRTTSQSAGTIEFNADKSDSLNMHDLVTNPERVTVPYDGIYLVTLSAYLNTGEGTNVVSISSSNSTYSPSYYGLKLYRSAGETGQNQVNLSGIFKLLANDYITASTIFAAIDGSAVTELAVTKIG